jgi:transcription antitermination factor NusG
MDMIDHDSDKKQWYAMRATYRRELIAKQLLDKEKIESFIPMHFVLSEKFGHKIKSLVPVIHNLIFVRECQSVLQQFKNRVPYLQYLTMKSGGKNLPIVVSDYQMNEFINVTKTYDDQLIFLRPNEIDLAKGTMVKIHGGLFDGREGVFMKINGKRNRRVVITIQNVIAVATAYIHPDLIEVIQ